MHDGQHEFKFSFQKKKRKITDGLKNNKVVPNAFPCSLLEQRKIFIHLFVLQVSVPVEVSEDGVQVKAWLPYEDYPQPDEVAAQIPANVRPQFERTESG